MEYSAADFQANSQDLALLWGPFMYTKMPEAPKLRMTTLNTA
jgi:hypothetical protein